MLIDHTTDLPTMYFDTVYMVMTKNDYDSIPRFYAIYESAVEDYKISVIEHGIERCWLLSFPIPQHMQLMGIPENYYIH